MHPKDYKGQRIIHPTKIFTLAKGKVYKDGTVTVFDEESSGYMWDMCYPLYDRVSVIASVEDYQSLIDTYSRELVDQIWNEFEVAYPIEAAAIVVTLYCDTYPEFLVITEAYKVNESYPDAKEQFKKVLQDRALSGKVKQMYLQAEAA